MVKVVIDGIERAISKDELIENLKAGNKIEIVLSAGENSSLIYLVIIMKM